MQIGQLRTSNYYRKMTEKQGQFNLIAIADCLTNKRIQKNMDTIMIHSEINNRKEDSETGNYQPGANRMRPFADVPYTYIEPDEKLRAEILPSSEKDEYTERDALMNQYMKQYRIDGEIKGNSFIQSSNEPARLILPDMVSNEELESFRKELTEQGLGQDIDWRGVKSDFWNMGVGFDNAERLDMKADYLASRYAVLKDRIQKQYAGDEQSEQMDILNQIYNSAKVEMADKYAKQIGGFYEDLGQDGTAEEFKISIMAMVDEKAASYEAHISKVGSYAQISNPKDHWLLQDDAYMAAQLRESYVLSENPIQSEDRLEGYQADDLMFAGVYAKSLSDQLKNIKQVWDVSQEDGALGEYLARQNIDIQQIARDANLSDRMEHMVNSIFVPYMDKFMDEVDKVLDHQQEMVSQNPWMSGTLRTSHVDRDRVYQVYYSSMNNMHN